MLKKGIYENIISQEVERDIHIAESQQMVCIREQIDNAESSKILADYLSLKSATTRLYDTEAKIICIVSKKGAQCIECHHKDI